MRFRERLKQEPIVYLATRMWQFGHEYRRTIIFYLLLSLFASVIWLTRPMLFGHVLNTIQIDGISSANIYYLVFGFVGLFLIDLLGWAFHGPSRIIENNTAFRIDRTYKKYLYNAVMSLPISWHADHDSGDTIDKINKATDAIFSFSRHSFNIVRVVVRVVGTTCILWFFNPYIAIAADLLLFAAFFAIFK